MFAWKLTSVRPCLRSRSRGRGRGRGRVHKHRPDFCWGSSGGQVAWDQFQSGLWTLTFLEGIRRELVHDGVERERRTVWESNDDLAIRSKDVLHLWDDVRVVGDYD